jgi:hypothetical protein
MDSGVDTLPKSLQNATPSAAFLERTPGGMGTSGVWFIPTTRPLLSKQRLAGFIQLTAKHGIPA